MLGCTSMIHLGIQWPKIRCSRAYAQHNMECSRAYAQHFQIIFSCVPDLYAQHICKYSCALKPLVQHKTSHRSCALGSIPNTKHFINHVLFGPCPTQPTYIYIYIIKNWLTSNTQNKSSCLYAMGSLNQYKINLSI